MATITLNAASILPPAASTTVVFNSFPVVAGENLSAGDWVYKKTSDGLYYLADNTTAEKSTVSGMVANSAATGQRFNFIQRDTELPVGAGPAQGRIYAISSTAGRMCDVADVATTSDIYLIALAQGGTTGNTLRFNCTTPTPGIQND